MLMIHVMMMMLSSYLTPKGTCNVNKGGCSGSQHQFSPPFSKLRFVGLCELHASLIFYTRVLVLVYI